MRQATHWRANFIPIATVVSIAGLLLGEPQEKPVLHILSPPNGTTVRPGKPFAVRIAGSGTFRAIGVLGDFAGGALLDPKGKGPWVVSLEIPLNTDPGVHTLGAMGSTESEDGIVSDNGVEIDVEPADIPAVTFSDSSLTIPVGFCVNVRSGSDLSCGFTLFVTGTYPDGTEVNLEESTRMNLVSQAPSIVKIQKDSALLAVSPGSTKVVAFGKYAIDVTVLDRRETSPPGFQGASGTPSASSEATPSLRIVSPVNGAVVRPGQKARFKVTGTGQFTILGIFEETAEGYIEDPGKPPWIVAVQIPQKIDPGIHTVQASGKTVSRAKVESDKLAIDVEPTEIPSVEFSEPSLTIPLHDCVVVRTRPAQKCGQYLFVQGTYADGTKVNLNGSTRIDWTSQSPSIVSVSKDGRLIGFSPGSTKVNVFGKYTIDVTVSKPQR